MLSDFSIKHANARVRTEAKRELLVTMAISFLPLILGFVAIAIPQANAPVASTPPEWFDVLVGAFKGVFFSGELYFYAMSLCASIFLVSQSANQDGNFGMRLWSGVFVLFCAGFMSFFIGSGDTISSAGFWLHGSVSVLFLILAAILYYRVKVLADQPPPNPEDVHRASAAAVTDASDPEYA